MSKSTDKFLKGTLILSIAALLAKLLSAFFRVPLTALIGNIGMGYYGYGYPIYSLCTAIAIVGIPSTIAKLVAEKRVMGKHKEAYLIFRNTLKLMIGVGALMSILLVVGAPVLISTFKWEKQTIYSLWGLSLSPLFVCIMGVYRGYFQGMQNMLPTAISQVVENLGRVAVGLTLAVLFLPDVGKAAGGASFGAVAGGICGSLVLLLMYLKKRSSILEEVNSQQSPVDKSITFRTVAKTVLWIAIPISIGAAVNSVMNFLDSALVASRLVTMGISEIDATAYFGQLTKVATFINFPLTFGMALVVGVVPAIAEAIAKNDQKEVQDKIELGTRFALLISLPAAVGLAVLAVPIMKFIYPTAPEGGKVLAVSALSIAFVMLGQAFTGIHQGRGRVWIPVKALFFAAIVKGICNYFLVATSLRVTGAAIASIIGYCIFAGYNYWMMKKETSFKLNISLVIIKPLIASAIMGVCAWGSYKGLSFILDPSSLKSNALMTLVGVGVGVVVYAVVLFAIGGISKEDVNQIRRKKEIIN